MSEINKEAMVGLNFKITQSLSNTIKKIQIDLSEKNIQMKLEDIYPELLELGIVGFKKKYKLWPGIL